MYANLKICHQYEIFLLKKQKEEICHFLINPEKQKQVCLAQFVKTLCILNAPAMKHICIAILAKNLSHSMNMLRKWTVLWKTS